MLLESSELEQPVSRGAVEQIPGIWADYWADGQAVPILQDLQMFVSFVCLH